MAPSSTALATKPHSGSPYQLDPAQALRAAKALTAHIKSSESAKAAQSTKKNLLEEDSSDEENAADGQVPIWLVVTTKKHVADKKRLKPAKIALPHPLSLPAQKLCLITADPQRSYKDLIEESAFPHELRERIGRVIGISKLKTKYKTYEARRQLYAEYDIFLADDRIITFLPNVLGKVFYKSTAKRPVPVNLMGNEKVPKDAEGKKPKKPTEDKSSSIVGSPAVVAKDIQKALDSALVHLSPTTTTSIRIAHAGFEPKKIAENLEAVVSGLTTQEKLIPKGWRNIRSIHIKGPETTALPIWLADELWVDEQDVLDEKHMPVDKSERLKITEGEQGKKRKSLEGAKEETADKPAKKTKKEKAQGDDLSKEIALRKERLKKQKAAARAET
ncbi:ribosomal protein L1p/L10e family-domain-containing protein [Macrophomina phaseolina]|uniref:Ribosomal protein L1p/L10e family-domain-containing protein n=1 Tax=Macrophomina phaseolina TaxID=35725 RepID=A0ABQ8GCM1_9PEZI|nr:ribosomal protein L1p/L10e family-domain-containing protein [Macrophomina phaseolina]